jgi:peptidoglycan L-alanyl-D-glutamate endopeptidase CwlK
MEGVHPALVAVLYKGLGYSPYDFGISQGIRTLAEQQKEVAEGDSETVRSAHLIQQSTGYGHAVDLYVFVDGKITWEHKYFRKVIQALFRAAIELGVQLEVGALWRDFLDSPHVQLAAWKYDGDYN